MRARRGAAAASGMEVGPDDLPVVLVHLSRVAAYRARRIGRLALDAGVDLVADVRPRVEPERLPAAAVLEGEAARDDCLGEQRLLLVVVPNADLTCQHAREVALHRHPVQEGQPGAVPHNVDTAAVTAAAHHREAAFRDVHGGDTRVTLAPGAVGLDDAQAARIRDNGPGRAGRDGAERRPGPIVGDEQLPVAPSVTLEAPTASPIR